MQRKRNTYIFGIDVYASDNVACLQSQNTTNPFPLARTGLGPRAFHPSIVSLLEVFIHADFDLDFEQGIRVRIARLCKRDAIAKALVAPCQSSIDDVFTVSHDGNKATVRTVQQRMGEYFGCADFFDGE